MFENIVTFPMCVQRRGDNEISAIKFYRYIIVPTCKALNAFVPPATRRAVAVAPSVRAQNNLWITGGLGCPLAHMMSITREPLSDDVTK